MIARRGTGGTGASGPEMVAILQTHREQTLAELRGNPATFDVLEVDYPSLVADPAPWAARVAAFVGTDLLPHPERMAAVVRADLHRNRSLPRAN